MSVVVEAIGQNSFSLFPSSSNLPISNSIAIVKGAPDVLLSKCVNIIDNEVRKINDEDKQYLAGIIDEFSSQALRVLAICYKHLNATTTDYSPTSVENSLTFVGLIASIDPERPEVKPAIQTCYDAGIRVVMITGDYVATAVAIAKRVGILDENEHSDNKSTTSKAIDCSSLRELGDQLTDIESTIEQNTKDKITKDEHILNNKKQELEKKIDELTARVDVYSRAKPVDKITIVRSLQRQGHVVSMTGIHLLH